MTEDLLDKLENRLRAPLPAGEAHLKMKPILPGGVSFRSSDPSTARKGAVMILLYKRDKQWYFPLIQRPIYDGVHSGQVAFPGGRYEETDEDLLATALRESQEEIGIETAKVKVIGRLSEFFVAVSNHLILPVVGFYNGRPEFIPEPREVDHVIEVPLSQLLDANLLKEKEITAASGYKLISPYFELENKVVWGATAMMLSEFVEILKEIG